MRRVQMQWLFIVGTAAMLSLSLLILAGCGGGGGPQTQTPVSNITPSPSAMFIALLPEVQRSATPVGTAKCEECHRDAHKDPDAAAFAMTAHAKNNVGCESCHGAGSVHVAAPTKTNILTGPDLTRPTVCGQCHGPIHDQFQNSRHASPVAAVVEEAGSNPNVYARTCFRCHSAAFRAFMIDDPLSHGMTPDQIDADINALTVDELQTFVTGTHESATCATCHDVHKNTANLDSAGDQQYLRRSTFNTGDPAVLAALAPGAPVKTYTTIDHMCGTCHNGRGAKNNDAFLASTASVTRPSYHEGPQYNMLLGYSGYEGTGALTSRTGSHSEIKDQCVHCHMPNKRHTFTVSLDTSCAPCHTPTDAASRQVALKNELLTGLLSLKTRMENWAKANVKDASGKLLNDPNQWDYVSNIQADVDPTNAPDQPADPTQKNIPIEIRRARHNYYFISRDHSFGVHNATYARLLLKIANDNLDALGVPRSVPAPLNMTTQQMQQVIDNQRKRQASAARQDL